MFYYSYQLLHSHALFNSVAISDSGWTDDELCASWFKNVFIPHAVSRNIENKPILLISDGHASHKTPEMRALAFQHNVLLYCLPPHTTHKLQPLDVGVFGPLQTAWSKHCQECAATCNSVTQASVVQEYMQVREQHMRPKAIEAAFRNTGIWPINPGLFIAADFGPSQASSTQMLTPSTYPARIPSSPLSAQMTNSSDMDWEEVCGTDGGETDAEADEEEMEEAEEAADVGGLEDEVETEADSGRECMVSI